MLGVLVVAAMLVAGAQGDATASMMKDVIYNRTLPRGERMHHKSFALSVLGHVAPAWQQIGHCHQSSSHKLIIPDVVLRHQASSSTAPRDKHCRYLPTAR